MNCKLVCLTLFLASGLQAMAQKSYQLDSPDGKLKTVVNVAKIISFSVSHEETEVLAPSSISMSLEGDEILGLHAKVAKVTRSAVNKIIPSPFYKEAEVTDSYNGMSLNFKGNWSGSSSNLVQVILSWKARPFVLTVQIQPCHTSLFSCFLICLHDPPQLHYSKGI